MFFASYLIKLHIIWSYKVFYLYFFLVFVLPLQFSCSVVSNSLWPHESQHARPPCPSPTPRVYSNSCPSSQWCHPAISSSVIPFSSCPQSLPAHLGKWPGLSVRCEKRVKFSVLFFPYRNPIVLVFFLKDYHLGEYSSLHRITLVPL